MRWLSSISYSVKAFFTKRKLDEQLSEEIRGHVDMATEANLARGMTPEEAGFAALREFGNVTSFQEEAREERGGVWLDTLGKDLKFALRRLLRSPAFTLTALTTLALCVGANVAIFAVVDALILRPLPFPEPARLMAVVNSYPGVGSSHAGPSISNYFERRESIKAFANMALFQPLTADVGEPGNPRKIEIARVTPDFFATLGVKLATGQMFTHAELTYQTAAVVVLTDEFWKSQFAADPAIVGKTLIADGLPSMIVGVLPPGFRFLGSKAHFFKPLAFNPPEQMPANRHNILPGMRMIARLAPGATVAEAQAQLDATDAREADVDPKAAFLKGWGYHSMVRPLHADYIREIQPILLLLQGGVLVLLLIGAVNLTNLLLVRTSGRGHELAVRQALGASRGRLARDAWLETTLLALGGGAIGLGLGAAGVKLFATLGANQLPLGATIAFDGRIAGIGLMAILLLGGLLAVAPIWFMRHLSINAGLQSVTAGGLPGGASQRLRHIFGVVQVALAFVLLCGAGLLGVSLNRVLAEPLGFARESILVGKIGLPWKGYPSALHQGYFVHRLEQGVANLPGGVDVAITNGLPFGGFTPSGPVSVEGRSGNGTGKVRVHYHAGVTADYWPTMGVPLLRGQLPGSESYAPKAPRVCVIDQALADTYWPDGDPIGQRLCFGPAFDPAQAVTIVGVVGTVKQMSVTEAKAQGMVYSPFVQFPTGWFFVVLRSPLPVGVMAASLRSVVKELDPERVTEITTMEQMIDDSLLIRRSPALLAALFAGVALILCAVGTYGVLAYAASHRRREIGVRLALGATPRQVVRLFLGMGARLLLGGFVLGLLATWATGRAMRSVLFEVSPFSPMIIGGVAGLMGLVVMVAILIPAVRAGAVDPCETLRHD